MHTIQVIDLSALDAMPSPVTRADCRAILTLPEGAWAYCVRELTTNTVEVTALHGPTSHFCPPGADIAICPTLDAVADTLLIWQV